MSQHHPVLRTVVLWLRTVAAAGWRKTKRENPTPHFLLFENLKGHTERVLLGVFLFAIQDQNYYSTGSGDGDCKLKETIHLHPKL